MPFGALNFSQLHKLLGEFSPVEVLVDLYFHSAYKQPGWVCLDNELTGNLYLSWIDYLGHLKV